MLLLVPLLATAGATPSNVVAPERVLEPEVVVLRDDALAALEEKNESLFKPKLARDKLKRALGMLRRVDKLTQDHADMLTHLGDAYSFAHQHLEAVSAYEEAAAATDVADPNSPRVAVALNRLADAPSRAGQRRGC